MGDAVGETISLTPSPASIVERPQLPIIRTPMVRIDRHGIITQANPQALRDFTGTRFPPSDKPETKGEGNFTGHHFNEFLTTESQQNLFIIIKKTIRASKAFAQGRRTDTIALPEVQVTTLTGERRWLRLKPTVTDTEVDFEIEDITIDKALEAAEDLLFSSGNMQEIIDRVQETLSTILPHDTATMMMFEYLDHNPRLAITQKWGYENGQAIMMDHKPIQKLNERPLLEEMHESKQPVVVQDTRKDKRYIRDVEGKTLSYIAAPIIIEGKVRGFINLNSFQIDFFNQSDLYIVQKFAEKIARAIQNAELSGYDPLTGLPNRRNWTKTALNEVGRSIRYHHPLTVLMLDLDHFKEVNDAYGHAAGDVVLKSLAKAWVAHTRGTDTVGRWGGEEFNVLLPETARTGAFTVAEALRLATSETEIAVPHGTLKKTVSIGSAQLPEFLTGEQNQNPEQVLAELRQKADEALYVVKQSGRDGVGVFMPGRKIIFSSGEEIESPDQVVVMKPKKTEKLTRNVNLLLPSPTAIMPDYWEIQIFRRKPAESVTPTEAATSHYESFAKYNVYSKGTDLQGETTHLIFKISGEQESEHSIANLYYGPSGSNFTGNLEYYEALKSGKLPEDSYAWVNILFPNNYNALF